MVDQGSEKDPVYAVSQLPCSPEEIITAESMPNEEILSAEKVSYVVRIAQAHRSRPSVVKL